jgi:hypothetical protein
MARSPFTTATLRALPLRAYAHRTANGVWSLRYNGATYSEATATEADIIRMANDIANELDWRRESRGGDSERDYNGE